MSVNKVYTNIDKVLAENYQTSLHHRSSYFSNFWNFERDGFYSQVCLSSRDLWVP